MVVAVEAVVALEPVVVADAVPVVGCEEAAAPVVGIWISVGAPTET